MRRVAQMPPQPVVGKEGRMQEKRGIRLQEAVKAIKLLHSDDPDSEQQLEDMLQQALEDDKAT